MQSEALGRAPIATDRSIIDVTHYRQHQPLFCDIGRRHTSKLRQLRWLSLGGLKGLLAKSSRGAREYAIVIWPSG